MKKLILLLLIPMAGCINEDEYSRENNKYAKENAAYANRDLTQERIADELTKIRQILETQK